MVEPYAQFLAFLVDDTVAEVHAEIALRASTDVNIAALVAEVVCRAVTVGQQRRYCGGHIDGRGKVTVAQRGLLSRSNGFFDLGEFVLLDRLFLEWRDVLLKGDLLVQVGLVVLSVHRSERERCHQHGDIYFFHLHNHHILYNV